MEYIIIGICIIVIAAIGVGIFLKFKSKTAEEPLISVTSKDKADIPLSVPQDKPAHDLIIQVEMLPAEMISDESGLVEITDSKVLARVNALVPGLAQVGNAVNNAVQAAQVHGQVLYRAIIPTGVNGKIEYTLFSQ